MRRLIVVVFVLAGCRSVEHQCEIDVPKGYYDSMQVCIMYKNEQLNAQSRGVSEYLENKRHPAGKGNVDTNCQSNCLNSGSTPDYCSSKCSY